MRSVFTIGPIVTREGGATHLCVAWSREAGTELASGPDRLSALRQLIEKAGASELVCDPELEAEARQVGLATAPLSPEVIEVRAGIALTVDHGPLLREAGPAVVELIRAASELARAAPWQALPPTATFELTAAGTATPWAGLFTSVEGREHGVVFARADQRLGVFLQDQPAFAVEAVEAFTGVRIAPHVIHTRGGETEPIPADALATLVAGTRALIELGAGARVGHGSCWAPRKTEVTARVRQVIPKVGRNDLCPCGSGKKYKRCHGGANA